MGNHPSMREFIEHRARLGTHKPTIAWTWAFGGIWDALEDPTPERILEARARAGLAVIQAEQVSMDNGEWRLAQEFSFEDPPPFPMISQRPLDRLQQPHPWLADERWGECIQSRLRDVDDFEERRKRLLKPNIRSQPTKEEVQDPEKPARGGGRRGKGGKGRGKNEEA